MAKTLIWAEGSPTSVKIGDTSTSLYLQIAKDNVAVDLTAVKSITVKIADTNKNYLKDISISSSNLPDGSQGILVVPLNSGNVNGLNSGDYYFEVWIVTADGDSEIYPDMNVTKFHVFNNIVGGTTILTTLTMQAFLDKITTTQNASETVLQAAQVGLQNMNTAINDLKNGNYPSPYSETIVGKDLNEVPTSVISYAANNVNQPEEISQDETYLFINYANILQEVSCQIVISDSGVFKRNGGYDSNGNATWKEWKESTLEMPVPYVSKDLNSLIIPSINFCTNNKNQPAKIDTNELYILINYVNGSGIAQAIISQKNVYFRTGSITNGTATFEEWHQLIPEIEVVKSITVDKSLASPNGDTTFSSFVEAMKYAYSLNKKVDVHVKNGTYDMIQEFSDKYGSDYLNTTTTEEGCYIGNGMHIVFEPDAQIVCHYAGTNTQILSMFSPLTAKNSDYILENVKIDSKNVRYSVHDDTQNFDDGTYYEHRYINCEFNHDNSSNSVSTTAPYALGGGLGKNCKIVILGGRYSSDVKNSFETAPISYHNSPLADAKSNIIVRNVYLDGALRFTWWGPSKKLTNILVSGCSIISGIITHVEVGGAGYDNNDNFKITSWNNEIRNQ